jgi:ABC-type transporter Mla subunit MlaD
MKIKNKSDYVITAVVVLCSLVVLAALTISLTDVSFLPPREVVNIDFRSVTGIRVNSQVRYAGAPAGSVTEVRILTTSEKEKAAQQGNPDANVRVTVAIMREIPPLTDGVQASIESDSLLSEKFVNLNPGPPGGPRITKDHVIAADRAIAFNEIIQSGYHAISKVDEILSDIRENNPELGKQLHTVIDDVQALAAQGSELVTKTNQLVAENKPRLERTFRNLDAVMANMDVTTANLKVVSTYARSLMLTLAERPWRIIWGGKTPSLPPEEVILKSGEPVPIPWTGPPEGPEKPPKVRR